MSSWKTNKRSSRHCSNSDFLFQYLTRRTSVADHIRQKNEIETKLWQSDSIFIHTCARRNISIMVRQEPQTKSTMLMNEWKRNARRRRRRRRKEKSWCWRWWYLCTPQDDDGREFFFSFSLDKIFSLKKRMPNSNSSSIWFHFWLLLLLLATC